MIPYLAPLADPEFDKKLWSKYPILQTDIEYHPLSTTALNFYRRAHKLHLSLPSLSNRKEEEFPMKLPMTILSENGARRRVFSVTITRTKIVSVSTSQNLPNMTAFSISIAQQICLRAHQHGNDSKPDIALPILVKHDSGCKSAASQDIETTSILFIMTFKHHELSGLEYGPHKSLFTTSLLYDHSKADDPIFCQRCFKIKNPSEAVGLGSCRGSENPGVHGNL